MTSVSAETLATAIAVQIAYDPDIVVVGGGSVRWSQDRLVEHLRRVVLDALPAGLNLLEG